MQKGCSTLKRPCAKQNSNYLTSNFEITRSKVLSVFAASDTGVACSNLAAAYGWSHTLCCVSSVLSHVVGHSHFWEIWNVHNFIIYSWNKQVGQNRKSWRRRRRRRNKIWSIYLSVLRAINYAFCVAYIQNVRRYVVDKTVIGTSTRIYSHFAETLRLSLFTLRMVPRKQTKSRSF